MDIEELRGKPLKINKELFNVLEQMGFKHYLNPHLDKLEYFTYHPTGAQIKLSFNRKRRISFINKKGTTLLTSPYTTIDELERFKKEVIFM